MDTPKDTALFWLSRGISTIPLVHRSKKPLISWTEFKSKLPAIAQIEQWYQVPRNIAIVSGWQGLCILDFDNPESYACWHVYQLENNPKVIDTYRVMSNRGIHVYYYLNEPIKLNSIQNALFEIKSSGRLCTTPPSIHESGKPYTSLDNPENIRTVKPEDILNYSPLHFAPIVFPLQRSRYAPTILNDNGTIANVLQIPILNWFNSAIAVDNEKRFYRTDCPFHGHKSNFWIDTKLNICGCYAGCIGQPKLDIIDFVSRLKQQSKKDTIAELRRLL